MKKICTGMFWVLFILLCFFIFPLISAAVIWVDQLSGMDNKDCLNFNEDSKISCASLHFAYKNTIRNENFTKIEIIINGNYVLYETLAMNVLSKNVSKILISGNSSTSTITSNSSDVNIVIGKQDNEFILNYNISFSTLIFEHFGKNATAVIVSWALHSLEIYNSKFINNKCSAINVIDTSIDVQFTSFENNVGSSVSKGQVYNKHLTFPYGINSAGGAATVLFSRRNVRPFAIFRNSSFIGNRAVSISGKVIIDTSEGSISFSHTGGAILLGFLNQSSYSTVILQGNKYEDNLASLGGAISLTFHDTSGQNSVKVKDSLFIRNHGTVCGGGFAIATWRQSSANSIIIENTNFTYNEATVGAGGRILLQSYQNIYSQTPARQTIKLKKVIFFQNKAASASGLHINFNLGTSKPLTPITLINVTFANHSTEVYKFSLQGPSAFSGVLLSNRVDLEFQEESSFEYNQVESSVFISNCELYVKDTLRFYKNTVQTSGGAMTLTDVSHLNLYPDSVLQFVDNYAPVQGGALYVQTVGFPDMVYKYNPSCFIQYFLKNDPIPPSQWKVSVQFVKNGAGLKGAAIYANTITPCVWDEEYPYYSFQKSLHWKGFNFSGNYISDKARPPTNPSELKKDTIDIATDTISFSLLDHGNKTIIASPGEDIPFKLVASDELSNKVYSVPVASLKENKEMHLVRKYFIVNPAGDNKKSLSLSYSLDSTAYEEVLKEERQIIEDITFVDSSSSFISNATIRVKARKCRPGFVFKDNQCVCDNLSGNHILRCEENIVYLENGYWGYVNPNGQLRVRPCPLNFCHCNQTDPVKLGCAFNVHSQCKNGRKGILCGECEKGKGLDLMTYECVQCNGFSSTMVIIIVVVAIATIIVVVLILAINPKFSTLLRSILFFVQMLPYVLDGSIGLNKVVLTITGWLDVGGLNSMPVKSCFVENFNSMYAVAMGYLYPVLIILVLIVVYILHKCYWVHLKRSSPFQAFWILIVLMYKFLVETSLLLLYCVPLEDQPQKRSVFYLDGSLQCFNGQHLPMAIVAMIVMFVAVFPPPILVLLVVKGHITARPGIVDSLTQGLGKHVRWWWSIDFLRRLVFISIYVFVTSSKLKQASLTICSVLALSIHIQKQPYRNTLANLGETFLLLCLTIIIIIEPMNDALDTTDKNKALVSTILISLAAFYCVSITLYVWIAYLIKRCRTSGYAQIDDLDKENDDEKHYKENLRRRISGGRKRYGNRWLSSVNRFRKSHSENIIGRRSGSSVPFTRSDLHDKI